MDTQKIKSFTLFILVIVAAFYAANSFAREAESFTTTDEENISADFLSIIEKLNAVEIDEKKILAIINENTVRIPDIRIVVPQVFGKENPFSSLSGPLGSLLNTGSFISPSDLPSFPLPTDSGTSQTPSSDVSPPPATSAEEATSEIPPEDSSLPTSAAPAPTTSDLPPVADEATPAEPTSQSATFTR